MPTARSAPTRCSTVPAAAGYQIVTAPIGADVYTLPIGAYSTNINGTIYYVSGSTYYKPYFDGSQVAYTVTQVG